MEKNNSSEVYVVLVNDEGQYSIWSQQMDIPEGWSQVGASGSKEECLAHVEQVWVDMRPKSLGLCRKNYLG
ncbi:MbtH family NRPS accessory protein [Endozoicomonas sp. SM1973]|uniref:MbtH family NRPS accessory protein n=1 Tax=Spartinivicinus marinus TaxID=2994442 RepID=A0A853IJP0_9GAMM|nr:MbtH family NRPS accessory protein [Spartinivicinus marinus]MCX4030118.1 MbtH family NRPS accessory protein [Spartinivicinus marinus]NYZ70321.1 MbtH family NRPS accessory protein [Spartinivicinus marinus]